MKHTTKQVLGIAVAAALVVGGSTGVFARGGFGPEYGPGWGGHHGMMGGPGGMYGMAGGPGMMGRSGGMYGMPGGPGMMGGPGGMHGMVGGPGWSGGDEPVAYTERYLRDLKATLGITEQQEGAWAAYAEAVKNKAELMTKHRRAFTEAAPTTTEQRLSFHEEGLEQMRKLVTATSDLYGSLTLEQQSRAGRLFGGHHGPGWAQ